MLNLEVGGLQQQMTTLGMNPVNEFTIDTGLLIEDWKRVAWSDASQFLSEFRINISQMAVHYVDVAIDIQPVP